MHFTRLCILSGESLKKILANTHYRQINETIMDLTKMIIWNTFENQWRKIKDQLLDKSIKYQQEEQQMGSPKMSQRL